MTKFAKIVLLLMIAVPTLFQALYAKETYTRGLYGQIEFQAISDSVKNGIDLNDRLSYVQKYSIGYESYLYSPLLLTYDVGATLYINDTDSVITASGSERESSYSSEHTNYKVYLNFIKSSNYPFTVYTERTDSPVWSVQADRNTFVKYQSDRSGIYGSLRSRILTLDYEVSSRDSKREESFASSTDKELKFMVGTNKQISDTQVAYANYTHRVVDYRYIDSGANIRSAVDGTIDEANAGHDWKISESVKLRSYARYYAYSYYDNSDLSATVNLNYAVTKRLSTNYSISLNEIKVGEDSNQYLTLTQGLSYVATDTITLRQSLLHFRALGDSVKLNYTDLLFGAAYSKSIATDLRATLGASVTGRTQQYDSSPDSNATLVNKDSITYSINAGLNKSFPQLKANAFVNGSYYQRFTTGSDFTNRATYSAGYNQAFSSNTNFHIKASGYQSENRYGDVNDTVARVDTYTADSAISYWSNIGYYGKMSLQAGISYSSGTFRERVAPYLSASFKYLLAKSLRFNANGRVSSDTVYNYTTYTGNAELRYTIRKMYSTLGARYTTQEGGSFGTREHINYYFRIGRNI